jgi:ApaG protein
MQKILNPHFNVKVKVIYNAEESKLENNYHFFTYKVSITNNSSATAQLMNRHWIITDNTGHIEEVRGAGVVGQQPKIKPGETFEYESVCPLNTTSGTMRGFYQFAGKGGENFEIEIPEFYLIAPTALH